jgi:hypothetical protein
MASLAERMIGAAKLDPHTYEEVEADQGAMGQAMAVVVISALAAGLGGIGGGGRGLVMTAVAALIGWFIWAGITYFVGTKIMPDPQTRADMGQLLRTMGFAASPGVFRALGFIPILGWLISFGASVWMLVAMVVAVRQALDYQSTGKAVAVCAIGFLVYLGLTMLLFAVGAIAGLGR